MHHQDWTVCQAAKLAGICKNNEHAHFAGWKKHLQVMRCCPEGKDMSPRRSGCVGPQNRACSLADLDMPSHDLENVGSQIRELRVSLISEIRQQRSDSVAV
jgi:hypothetical protein